MAEGRTAWPKVEDDWFVEPPGATHFLLTFEYFTGGIWDPACGQGNIVEACLLDGHDAVGSDLRDRLTKYDQAHLGPRYPIQGSCPSWFLGTMDFLQHPLEGPYRPNIVCNAPYGRAKLAEAFIRKAVTLPGVQKAAFFVNSKFLFGAGRAMGLFRDHPPPRLSGVPQAIVPAWPVPAGWRQGRGWRGEFRVAGLRSRGAVLGDRVHLGRPRIVGRAGTPHLTRRALTIGWTLRWRETAPARQPGATDLDSSAPP
jgi:hypothetical protein